MASIWLDTKGGPSVKIRGNLKPSHATMSFPQHVRAAAEEAGARPDWRGRLHCLLRKKGQPDKLLFVELLSPPSAPEPHQPKRIDGGVVLPKGSPLPKGVILLKNGTVPIGGAGAAA